MCRGRFDYAKVGQLQTLGVQLSDFEAELDPPLPVAVRTTL